MKSFVALSIAVFLGACGHVAVLPSELPKDARGAVWTNRAADQVAACIVRAVGGRVASHTDVEQRIVTTDGVRSTTYVVTTPTHPVTDFQTLVYIVGGEIRGNDDRKAVYCTSGDSTDQLER